MSVAPHNRFSALFDQLGLDSEPQAIARFISQNKLPEGTPIYEAEFWDESQRKFLKTSLAQDAEWAIQVDALALALGC